MKKILLPIFLIGIALWLANCTQSGPCTGSLTLENPIPDITVAVGDTVLIDLTNPPVFVSTEEEVTYSIAGVSGAFNAGTNLVSNQGIIMLEITGRAVGERALELIATSDCLENSQLLIITVIES